MKSRDFLIVLLSLVAVLARADTIGIGSAAAFSVLGEAGVTNTGPSILHGSVAGSTATPAVIGFPPGQVVGGSIFPLGVANAGPGTPFGDATTAYLAAQAAAGAVNKSGLTLGSGGTIPTLSPGVYSFATSANLSGLLILDGGGNNAASWIFQIGTSLLTASGSSVEVTNVGGSGPFNGSITWAVGSTAILDTTTNFLGTIISNSAGDVLKTGATIGCGRVISLTGSVTLDSNVIDSPADCSVVAGTGGPGGGGGTILPPASVPEPSTFAMLSSALLAVSFLAFRKKCRERVAFAPARIPGIINASAAPIPPETRRS